MLEILQNDIQAGVILIVVLIFSLCFHEFSHAYVAYRLGDDTAAYQGRLTLNPLAHLDPIGSLMLLLVGFGYAKPVPINPMNFNNPRKDSMKVGFAGPASNILLCLVGCLIMRILGVENLLEVGRRGVELTILGTILYYFSSINMTLAIFNLIPIYPLDGGQIFGGFLDKINPKLSDKLREHGPKVLMAIIFLGIFTGFSIIGLLIYPFQFLVTLMAGLY